MDRSEDANEGVDERAQDKHEGALGQHLGASAETVGAETEVVRDRLGEVGVLGVELGGRGDGVERAQELVRGGDGRDEEEAGGGQAGGRGEGDLQQQVVFAVVVQGAQVVEVGDHVDGQPGEGGGVEGDGVDGGAEDGDEAEHLPVAHNGARGGPGQPGVGGRGGAAGEEGEGNGDAEQVGGQGGQDGEVVGGVEGIEQVVVGQVAQQGERGQVEPVVAGGKGEDERDDLPAHDSGNLAVGGQVAADGGQLEAGEVGEGAVGKCADAQAAHDDQRQTQPGGQPRGRRQLWRLHLQRVEACDGLRGEITCLDFSVELLVGPDCQERNVGCHQEKKCVLRV